MVFSVVVPTFRRPKVLARTLECLEKQECGFPFELILVNDGPPDELPELNFGQGRRTNWRSIQNETNLKRAATRNRGIKAAQGKYVLMLDDDIWAVPGLLQAHYDKQQEIRDGAAIGAAPPDPAIPNTVWNRYQKNRVNSIRERLRKGPIDYGLFLTGNVSVPLAILRSVDGFDETFKEYSFEDTELGLRLHRAGVPFAFAEDAIGFHSFDENLGIICRKAFEMGRSAHAFTRTHPDQSRAIQYHSSVIQPWAATEIAKNIVKLLLFNRVFRFSARIFALLTAFLRLDGIVLVLLPWLELSYRAHGVRRAVEELHGGGCT